MTDKKTPEAILDLLDQAWSLLEEAPAPATSETREAALLLDRAQIMAQGAELSDISLDLDIACQVLEREDASSSKDRPGATTALLRKAGLPMARARERLEPMAEQHLHSGWSPSPEADFSTEDALRIRIASAGRHIRKNRHETTPPLSLLGNRQGLIDQLAGLQARMQAQEVLRSIPDAS